MTGLPHHGAWMQTRQGLAFDYVNPTPHHINVVDAAYALAHINRFCGHLTQPVNVAQHSLLVQEIVRTTAPAHPSWLLIQALVHDVPEAYLSDIPAPLKRLLPEYQAVEARVWAACALKFDVPLDLVHVVKQADWYACCLEAWRGFPRDPLGGWAGPDPLKTAPDSVIEILTAQHTPDEWAKKWLSALSEHCGGTL